MRQGRFQCLYSYHDQLFYSWTTAIETEIAATTTVEPTKVEPQINGKDLLIISSYMVLKLLLSNFSRHIPQNMLWMCAVLYIYYAILFYKGKY